MNAHEEFERDQQLEKKGINLKSWPHQFTRGGSQKVIGENPNFQPDGETNAKIVSYEMVCVHCHARYWTISEGPPVGMCPARNKARELKRILGS